MEWNVERRVGVFRCDNYGPTFSLWFEPSLGNRGYTDSRDELLTDKAIAQLESKYDVVLE